MADFLRSTMILNESLTAGGTRRVDDLPVNPLSVILYTLRALNLTGNTLHTIENLLSVVSNIEVLFRGSAIISGSLLDLSMISMLLNRHSLVHQPHINTASGVTRITVPILMGRRPFWRNEAFPAVRRGELQLATTPAATFTNVGTVTLQVETIELPEATPEQFLKYTTISKTPSATGDHDTDLPIGNRIAGVLLFGTTVPTGITATASIATLRLLLDNIEAFYARANWDSLHGDLMTRLAYPFMLTNHFHLENAAGAYTQNVDTAGAEWDEHLVNNYAYMDFDPLTDGQYFLATENRSRVHMRITADVADAIRIIPIELLTTGQAGTPTP